MEGGGEGGRWGGGWGGDGGDGEVGFRFDGMWVGGGGKWGVLGRACMGVRAGVLVLGVCVGVWNCVCVCSGVCI